MLTGLFSSFLPATAAKAAGWLVAAITVIPLLGKLLIVNVQQWEHGYFLRFGKPVVVKKTGKVKLAPPGVYFVFPLFRQIQVISTQQTPCDPIAQTVTTLDDIVMSINLSASYIRLVDEDSMTQAIVRIQNLPQMVLNQVTDALVRCVGRMTYAEVVRVEHLCNAVLSACDPCAREDIGVTVASIGLQTIAKTGDQLRKEGQLAIAAAILASGEAPAGAIADENE